MKINMLGNIFLVNIYHTLHLKGMLVSDIVLKLDHYYKNNLQIPPRKESCLKPVKSI